MPIHHRYWAGSNTQSTTPPLPCPIEVVEKGDRYLKHHARQWEAEFDNGIHGPTSQREAEREVGKKFDDTIFQLLMLEITGTWSTSASRKGTWNHTDAESAATTGDALLEAIEIESIADTIIKPTDHAAHRILDHMLASHETEGTVQAYLSKGQSRVSVEVCANICTFFHTYGRNHQVCLLSRFVLAQLKRRDAYSTQYFASPEPFIYYCLRLLKASPASSPASSTAALERADLRDALKERVRARIGADAGNAVCVAIRVLVCQELEMENREDLKALVGLQEEDGGFGVGWWFAVGDGGVKVGHRGLTAALAVEAIREAFKRGDLVVREEGEDGDGNGGKRWFGWAFG